MMDKEFDTFIQNQLAGNGLNHTEDYEQLSEEQKRHYHTNRRAIARLNYQAKKDDNINLIFN